MKEKIKNVIVEQHRDVRYLLGLLIGIVILLNTSMSVAAQNDLDTFERSLFLLLNDVPAWLDQVFYVITQAGSFLAIFFWVALGYSLGKVRGTISVTLSTISSWWLAKVLKEFFQRGRPSEFFENLSLTSGENFAGLGYPSGHAAVGAAAAFSLMYYSPKKYRKYLYIAALLIGISRISLGGHLPRDVIGGWSLGVIVAGFVSYLVGHGARMVPHKLIAKQLRTINFDVKSIQELDVDARGSVPLKITDKSDKEYFAKLFGKQEHISDWLYKSFRFFKFKSFENEDPFLNKKRNIENEVLCSMWARKHGVNTPEPLGLVSVGSYWLLLSEFVEGKVVSATLKKKQIAQIFQQIELLHSANIAHRDLRADNMMISAEKVYLLDFAFADLSPPTLRIKIDLVELIASLSVSNNYKTVIDIARRNYSGDLAEVVPYFDKSVLSKSTKDKLDDNGLELSEIKKYIKSCCGKPSHDAPDIRRITKKSIFNFILFSAAVIFIIPRFEQFRGQLNELGSASIVSASIAAAASMLTYIFAAGVIVALAKNPIRLRDALSVQLANSYIGRVLPKGIAGTIVNVRFLIKQGLSKSEASSIIATERIIGVIGFVVPAVAILIINGHSIKDLVNINLPEAKTVLILIISLITIATWARIKFRDKIVSFLKDLKTELISTLSSPKQLIMAFVFSLMITASYVVALHFSLASFGIDIALFQLLLVYASGVFASTVSPTPGGLGATELAMIASLNALTQSSNVFIAIILYRLVTFWLPVPFGFISYQYASKKDLI